MKKRIRKRAYLSLPMHLEGLESRELLSAAASTTTLLPSPVIASFGQTVNLTATVTSRTGSPDGIVTFLDGAVTLGTASVNSTTHKATLAATNLNLGSNALMATYDGSTNFLTSSSVAFNEKVNPAATTTKISSSSTAALFGQTVTLTAAVTSTDGIPPGGTVTFKNGLTVLGSATVDSTTGLASINTSSLSVGGHMLTATYGGTTDFAASNSGLIVETIKIVPTTSTLVSTLTPSVYGNTVTFTATLTPAFGDPAGSYVFRDGITILGTVPVDTGTEQASVSTSALLAGAHSITATYVPPTGYAASTSPIFKETITPAVTTLSLASTNTSPTYGQPVTFTATLTNTSDAQLPTGTVTFKNGTAILGMVKLNSATGQASLSSSLLTVGSHNITAVYAGPTSFAAATDGLTEVVNAINTTTTLSTSPTVNSSFAQSVTLTATVFAVSGNAAGIVKFFDGDTLLGSAGIINHTATLRTTTLALGSHSLTAMYTGSLTCAVSSSAAVGLTVGATTTALNVSPGTASFGETVTLTATVASQSGAAIPTGTVTFLSGLNIGGATLGFATVNTKTGVAVLTTSSLSVGEHTLFAEYTGSKSFSISESTAASETVSPGESTTTTLAATPTNTGVGQTVTLTATVTPNTGGGTSAPILTGSVTFLDGTETLGTVAVNSSTDQAALPVTNFALGTHSLTAVYTGVEDSFIASTSPAVTETIGGTTTGLVLSSANTVTLGQSVTLTATVAPGQNGQPTPTGTVTFLDGATTLSTAAVNSSGQATFSEYSLFTGTHAFTAVYSGDATDSASTGAATLTIKAPTYSIRTGNLGVATITPGTGTAVIAGEYLQIDYTGYLTNGTEFDSSLNPGRTPFQFILGNGEVIAGWDQGIPGMKVGETRVLNIPGALAYGATPPSGSNIPANATLIFVVHLLSIQPRIAVYNGTAQIPLGTEGADFGTLGVGVASDVVTFNLYLADSNDRSLGANGSVKISDSTNFSLVPNGATAFTVQFTPTSKGVFTATITVPTTDPGVPNFTFTVTGVGD